MFISHIKLFNFKNHLHKHLIFSKKVNCFYGKNGIGKTNILDAIQYISSFKNMNQLSDASLINEDSDFFRIESLVNTKDSIVIKYSKRRKSVEINEVKINKISTIFGHLPMVLSSPYDIFFLFGGSEERRKFLDYTISIYDKKYLECLLIYNKYLEQRNAHLKNEISINPELIEIYNQKLVLNGTYIYNQRKAFCHRLESILKKWYHTISDQSDAIEIHYYSPLLTENFTDLLEKSIEKDKILKRTTQGIHKDDLECFLKSIDMKKIGSQGQQKTFLYSLKLAQAELLHEMTQKKIIFLLDDFSDKLDVFRHTNLQKIIHDIDFISQWFITDTSKECFNEIEGKEVFEVS